ncbi:MAG: SDR family oxidoreductase [Planctomycetes bacterium]|nr:SDR family oxidoreductase [Planctomycetota bacterium]
MRDTDERRGEDKRNVLDFFRLDGRVALVTGGSRGLGKSMALGLAQAGATTALCARHLDACEAAAAEIAAQTGQTCLGLAADATREEEVKRLVEAVVKRFGRLDVLINSAGVNIRGPIEQLSLDEFTQVMSVNVTATWLCCRAVAPVMKPQRRGSIISIGSTLSAVGLGERTPYCSSKHAVVGLTRALALELAADGVRCNAICPGPFLTEMNLPLLKEPEKVKAIISQLPLNRWGELHEIRGAALFLASDASSYVTGATLFVDAGWTAK